MAPVRASEIISKFDDAHALIRREVEIRGLKRGEILFEDYSGMNILKKSESFFAIEK